MEGDPTQRLTPLSCSSPSLPVILPFFSYSFSSVTSSFFGLPGNGGRPSKVVAVANNSSSLILYRSRIVYACSWGSENDISNDLVSQIRDSLSEDSLPWGILSRGSRDDVRIAMAIICLLSFFISLLRSHVWGLRKNTNVEQFAFWLTFVSFSLCYWEVTSDMRYLVARILTSTSPPWRVGVTKIVKMGDFSAPYCFEYAKLRRHVIFQ